jgi:ribosomal protein S18 acetylase RimI-like enzyme
VEHPAALGALAAGGESFVVRRACRGDVPALVALLADDPLGRGRETAPPETYLAAFDAVDASAEQLLVVVTSAGAEVVGTLQLSFIPGLSRGGALRGQIEAVRVHRDHRNRGLGRALVEWAVEECRARGCALVQLTSDRSRVDAHRFYEALGFVHSHAGLKRALDP